MLLCVGWSTCAIFLCSPPWALLSHIDPCAHYWCWCYEKFVIPAFIMTSIAIAKHTIHISHHCPMCCRYVSLWSEQWVGILLMWQWISLSDRATRADSDMRNNTAESGHKPTVRNQCQVIAWSGSGSTISLQLQGCGLTSSVLTIHWIHLCPQLLGSSPSDPSTHYFRL